MTAANEPTGTVSSVLDVVNKTVEVPTIPEVLVKLNHVMADPAASAGDAAKVIATDPAIATNLLRLVNSAQFGLQVRVTQIAQAIAIMGFRATKKAALRAAVLSVFARRRDRVAHFDATGFWKHSIFTGIAARRLAKASPCFQGVDVEDLYTCGLLHDIGKLILLERAPDEYVRLLQHAVQTRRHELDVEHEMLGFSHADVGSVLAIRWLLPEDLTIAIRYHHAPAKDPFHQSLSSIIHLADHFAWGASKPSTQDTPSPPLDVEVYDRIGLPADRVEELLPQIEQEFAVTDLPW